MEHTQDIKDEKDYFEIPEFLITWEWLKKTNPNRKEQFEFAELLYLHGYTTREIAEIRNYSNTKVSRDINSVLQFVKEKLME